MPSHFHPNLYVKTANELSNRFVETEIEECLKSRTDQLAQFRDLGAPDLVHYRRVNGNKEVKLPPWNN